MRAWRASVSDTRSMYSTWKIAFDSACAGPSWISWASRRRSASCASMMRIWTSAASGAVLGSATSEPSPRLRNSHVRSRLSWARPIRASSAW